MNALGLMEFYGYVPAIDALDIALKAADVSLQSCSLNGGGLVSVFVTGGVGAVSAALSAVRGSMGSALLSSSLIPRPAAQLAWLLEESPRSPLSAPKPPHADKGPASASLPMIAESGAGGSPGALEEIEKELAREERAAREELEAMTLKELRAFVRQMNIPGMNAEKIRKLSKATLIDAIMREEER
ncbi:MAG: BMC domain-containing protein [Synergistaceae bacterium]|nr:BMC domain-containing protein [Synergistaceae bacterium]